MSTTKLILVGAAALATTASATTFFQDKFDSNPLDGRWVQSEHKDKASRGDFAWDAGKWPADEEENKGLRTTGDVKFHAASAKLETSIPAHTLGAGNSDIVVQFQVKNEDREYSFCGGGYIKLLPKMEAKDFGGDSPYSIMFGPDMCGYDVSRIHAIFTNGEGKNLLKEDEVKLEYSDKNEFSHLYTLHVKKDGTYEILFDQNSKAKGKIEDHWDFEKEMVDDPDDKKPSDWVDDKEIDDPEDVKPDGYDDVEKQIRDPEASKPEDWDDEDDGEWEAPLIDNSEYKGEWKSKRITNPEYKGEWSPKQIKNDNYDSSLVSWPELEHVGFELWTVNSGSIFDNIYVGDSIEEANALADSTWGKFKEEEKAVKEKYDAAKKEKEEAAKKEEEAKKEAEAADKEDEEEEEDNVDDVDDEDEKKEL
jgi:calreticulin